MLNENRDADVESVLDRELIGMIKTGQSEEVRKRIERFINR